MAQHLLRVHDAGRTEVLLGDYNLSGLWPVLDDAAEGDAAPAVRCFGSQRPVVDHGPGGTTRVHLPLSVWGERLGVLVV
jgi:hypothetical protein